MLHIITGSSRLATLQDAAFDLAPRGATIKINPGAESPPSARADLYTTIIGLAAQGVDLAVATHDELFIGAVQAALACKTIPAAAKITFVDGRVLHHSDIDSLGYITNSEVNALVRKHITAPMAESGHALFAARREARVQPEEP